MWFFFALLLGRPSRPRVAGTWRLRFRAAKRRPRRACWSSWPPAIAPSSTTANPASRPWAKTPSSSVSHPVPPPKPASLRDLAMCFMYQTSADQEMEARGSSANDPVLRGVAIIAGYFRLLRYGRVSFLDSFFDENKTTPCGTLNRTLVNVFLRFNVRDVLDRRKGTAKWKRDIASISRLVKFRTPSPPNRVISLSIFHWSLTCKAGDQSM